MKAKEVLKKFRDPKNFFNRDLSWLEFNRRVLEEALSPELPLLDRVKFLSIFHSNLDEFFMIRVSGIKEQIAASKSEPTIDGMTPLQELREIKAVLLPMLRQIELYWKKEILPGLKKHNIHFTHWEELTQSEQDKLTEYFQEQIYPIITPITVDSARPFPLISNMSLNIGLIVKDPKGQRNFARVKIPSDSINRLIRVDEVLSKKKFSGNGGCSARFMWLGELMRAHLPTLFRSMEIEGSYMFRVTRDTDVEIQEDEADDLLVAIQDNIRQQRKGAAVRLEVEVEMSEDILEELIENLNITREDVYRMELPLGMSSLMELYSLPLHDLKEKPFYPAIPKYFENKPDMFSVIRKRDILIHHPFDSFVSIIDFIKNAANDPDVITIKQTLYRVGKDSPIIQSLIEAAQNNKQVAVLVELKARFDEENNIKWAQSLEDAGVHVIYGVAGLKTHSKLTLVVRRESGKIRRYAHIGTGNYNATTAKIYTDLGLFTCEEKLCSEVSHLFNYLTAKSEPETLKELIAAPFGMREHFLEMIDREIKNKLAGGSGRIIMKMNALVDPAIIAALYEASCAGVSIELIVRGICCLVPGVKDLSENIKVCSIVGRFLEHSRIYYFLNNGSNDLYISSADMMQRNLDRRVETATPIQDPELKRYILETILPIYLQDNSKARDLDSEMKYHLRKPGKSERARNAQEWFMRNSTSKGRIKVYTEEQSIGKKEQ